MNKDACYELGHVVKAHGTKGQVLIELDVDYPEDYDDMESVFLEIQGKLIPFFIEHMEPQQKSRFIVKFEDINSMPEADKLRYTRLYLPLDTLPELDEDQFYFHEIVGYTVVDEKLGKLGAVKEIFNLPHQDLASMDYQGNEVLIPIHEDVVLRVDRNEKLLHVNLPEGLLEVYTTPSAPDDEDTGEEDAD
ncbi:MAG: ribosome maturation factor RimM [Hymenobacteraceae bacterium]|nr:ribosome maturation factor RimM [Hymenobacteraceae bacterium]MDX5395923.1 ribosome maturation factor RimM [Hymenobacteraceae bacterium]MDX5443872.1 ribosome maturation factor RimM [Hymenobacteraceae bacterium]MDX5511981.1 ribosome maturation factor RimM [Hymenobacteraceae bacterium]